MVCVSDIVESVNMSIDLDTQGFMQIISALAKKDICGQHLVLLLLLASCSEEDLHDEFVPRYI